MDAPALPSQSSEPRAFDSPGGDTLAVVLEEPQRWHLVEDAGATTPYGQLAGEHHLAVPRMIDIQRFHEVRRSVHHRLVQVGFGEVAAAARGLPRAPSSSGKLAISRTIASASSRCSGNRRRATSLKIST